MALPPYKWQIPYLWGYAVAGSLSCVLAQSHLTQKGQGLNFSQQQFRAHRRSRPGLHTAKGFTTWEKETKCRGSALLFCFGGGGVFSKENEPYRSRLRRRESKNRDTFRERVTAAFSSKTRFPPTLPVEEPPSSGTPGSRELNADKGVPKICLSVATAAVMKGDVTRGMDVFLQCMSRRRSKASDDGTQMTRGNSHDRIGTSKGIANGSSSSRGRISIGDAGGVQACNKFLRSLGDAGKIDDAVVAYEAMLRSGVRPTIVTFSTLISRAGTSRRVRVAERFYEEMLEAGITPDVQAMNSLINAFSKAGSPDQALQAFDEMSAYGVTPSVITFNSLIDACARAGDIDRARQVFSRLIATGLRPNDRTFSALIHSHARCGQVDEAFALLQEMRARGLVPNSVIYSALINACGRAGQLARAFQTLDEMYRTGIEPNVVTWTTLIDACGKGKELEWSFRLFKEMRERGTVPNSVTCSALMDACLKSGEVDLAFAVLEHMLDVGIEPTEVTYTSLLTQCARLGQAKRAAVVLDKLNRKRGSSSSISSGIGSNETPKGKPASESASGVVESSDQPGSGRGRNVGSWRMDPKLEKDLLKLFGKADQVDAAFKVLESMVARRDSPDSETWLLFLNAVSTAGELDKAVALLERSRAEGHGSQINELTYSALLEACGRAKKLERAFRIVQGMRDSGVKPTEATYLALMEVCRHSRDSKAAVEVFEAMETEGVRPGVGSYTSLLKVISEENTLRTREIQRERMLEARTHIPAPSVASGSDKEEARPPPTKGSSHQTSPRELPPPEAVAMASQAAELVEEESTKTVAGVKGAAREAASFSAGFPMEGSDAAGNPSTSHPESKVSPPRLSPEITPLASASFSSENPALDNLFRVFLVFQEMKSSGVKPDLRAYNALVNTCADLGEFERALGVVRQMVDDDHGGGLQPDVVTYTSLIKAAARSNPPRVEESEEIFATMQQRTNHFSTFVQPTEVTYAHLMKASLVAGKHSRALELWRQQLSSGVPPGARSTRVALAACAKGGDVATALEVYGMMRASGIRPENRSLLDLVNLCLANGMRDEAGRILRERSSNGIGGSGNTWRNAPEISATVKAESGNE